MLECLLGFRLPICWLLLYTDAISRLSIKSGTMRARIGLELKGTPHIGDLLLAPLQHSHNAHKGSRFLSKQQHHCQRNRGSRHFSENGRA